MYDETLCEFSYRLLNNILNFFFQYKCKLRSDVNPVSVRMKTVSTSWFLPFGTLYILPFWLWEKLNSI